MIGALALAGYIATIPLANWFIGNVGWCAGAPSPCLLPVGIDLWAPSGVLFAGLAFSLRDAVQERLGKPAVLVGIGIGTMLSLVLSNPFVAAASALAFLVSEFLDFLVYTRLRRNGFTVALVVSNIVGSLVDSAVFLGVAGFPMALLVGLVVGKGWTILLAVAVLWLWHRNRQSAGATA